MCERERDALQSMATCIVPKIYCVHFIRTSPSRRNQQRRKQREFLRLPQWTTPLKSQRYEYWSDTILKRRTQGPESNIVPHSFSQITEEEAKKMDSQDSTTVNGSKTEVEPEPEEEELSKVS